MKKFLLPVLVGSALAALPLFTFAILAVTQTSPAAAQGCTACDDIGLEPDCECDVECTVGPDEFYEGEMCFLGNTCPTGDSCVRSSSNVEQQAATKCEAEHAGLGGCIVTKCVCSCTLPPESTFGLCYLN